MSLKLPYGCHTAKILRKQEIASFILTEIAYAPCLKLPKHSHERACFSLVLQGSFNESYGAKSRVCEQSTVVFLPSNEAHSDRFLNAGSRCFHFEIAPEWLARLSPCSAVLEHSVDFQGGILNNLAIRLYREFRAMDAVSSLSIEGLAFEIIAELARRRLRSVANEHPLRRLEEARGFLHAHFNEEVGLAQVAETVDVHPVYLARAFRKHYHCTVGEYVRRLRIEFACRELSSSAAPLAQVAQAAGFFDQSHFSKTFKLVTGIRPAAYRKLFRSG